MLLSAVAAPDLAKKKAQEKKIIFISIITATPVNRKLLDENRNSALRESSIWVSVRKKKLGRMLHVDLSNSRYVIMKYLEQNLDY